MSEQYAIYLLIIVLSSFLWRVRGGLRFWGKKVPLNKIWYAVFFSIVVCYFYGWHAGLALTAFMASYIGYQLYGWGVYISRILNGMNLSRQEDKECELIDELLYPIHITIKGNKTYLHEYPKLFGFLGTCLTGLILTFLMGLVVNSVGLIFWGFGMGFCYLLGSYAEKYYALGKAGWNWGEYFFGFYLGVGYILFMS